MENSKVFLCRCCFHYKSKKHMRKCSEGHPVCVSCIKKSIYTKIGEGNPSSQCIAMCSDEICNGTYSYELLRSIVGTETMNEMTKIESMNAVYHSNIRDMFVCAHCGYQFSLINKKAYRVKCCPICQKGTCVRCGLKEHPGRTCKVAINDERLHQKGISICPKCRCEFIKDKGCNMIKCSKCGTRFCYVCGKILPDSIGYKHFSYAKKCPKNRCPLRSKISVNRDIEAKLQDILQSFINEDKAISENRSLSIEWSNENENKLIRQENSNKKENLSINKELSHENENQLFIQEISNVNENQLIYQQWSNANENQLIIQNLSKVCENQLIHQQLADVNENQLIDQQLANVNENQFQYQELFDRLHSQLSVLF